MIFGVVTKTALGKKMAAVAGTFAALAMGSNPAMANSAASAADQFRIGEQSEMQRDITALGEADGEFRDLYAGWGFTASVDVKPTTAVSVPALYPLDMNNVRTSSGFGARSAPLPGASRNHKGIDLAAPIGTPIYATADGMIERSGWASGYGKVVYIDHGNGIQTRYGHMSARSVFEGDTVRKGDVIGYVGSTGLSTGPHLHYEMYRGGRTINPSSVKFIERAQLAGSDLANFRSRLAEVTKIAPGEKKMAEAPKPKQDRPAREIDLLAKKIG